MRFLLALTLLCLISTSLVCSDEVDRQELSPNRADEPIAPFNARKAAQFLDAASLQWQKNQQCFTCHTNYAYLIARPALGKDAPALKQVRDFAETLIKDRWLTKGPRWDAEVVATGSFLAINDAKTTGKLHPLTRKALDQMWTLQRPDGGWTWLKCEWPPMEIDDHYGATLAAIGVGMAPDGYAQTAAAQTGMIKLKKYFAEQPPRFPHHRAMLLWAQAKMPDLITGAEKQKWVTELLSLQKSDGGWNSATLGNWKRQDGKPQDTDTSDGYATGFVVFVLRQAGIAADRPELQKGVHWLQSNQRESGRWFARSLFKDSKHYLSHAASAFAIMALEECNALNIDEQPKTKR
jgi:squalene-hopene/tetraprenyl-beta-curcumene cyclase